MRKDFLSKILLMAAVIAIAGLSQANFAQRRARKPSAEQLAAEQVWPDFFKAFRVAVSKRDRTALKEMMVPDFFFSGGGGDDNGDGDTRDEAFKFLDDPQVHGWQALAKTLTSGAVPSPPNPNDGGKKYISRVAPASARNIKDLSTAPPWIAFFEFRDGHWYCTSFSECCD
jgi:hypothetical protein